MLGLKPVKLMPARERVASALRKAIISRQIKEGETLALEATAQELGVSITPVREAFQILARDGLLELKQNKGATVALRGNRGRSLCPAKLSEGIGGDDRFRRQQQIFGYEPVVPLRDLECVGE